MNTLKEFGQWLEEQETNQAKSSFSIEQLKLLTKLSEIDSYLLQTIGSPSAQGEFRKIYSLDGTSIIKVAKNFGAIEQNKQELIHAECLGTEFAIQVIDHDSRFHWIIEERVEPLSEHQFIEQFNNKLGTKFQKRTMLANDFDMDTVLMITNVISHIVIRKERQSYQNIYPLFKRSNWFMELAEKLRGCEVSSNDFHHENWGIRPSTGELILLDLGF